MSSTTSSTSLSSVHPQTTLESESHLGCDKSGGFLDSTLKMTGYRKRRLSKVPAPVIIPPPSPIVTAPSPVSPAISDSFLELPSPKAPQSPTKRFVLKPITALTAAFQRTSITGRNRSSSLLRLTKSSNNSPKSPKSGSPKASPQSPKPPKSPKLLHRKGSSGSIRKHSESPTVSAANSANAVSFLSANATTSPTNNSKSSFFGKPSFSLSINTTSQTPTKSPSKLGKFRPPKSPSSCRKALPIAPAELAERLRGGPSYNYKADDECPLHFDENSNNMFKPLHPNKIPKPVLIDVRNLALYQDEHICESFNVNLPTLLIKRYRRGTMSKFSLDSFITTPEGRDRYLDRVQDDGGKYQHDIIVFDETMDETDRISPGWTLLSVLERAMLSFHHSPSSENIDENYDVHRGRVYWLKGGFEAFRSWDKCKEFIVAGPDVGETCDRNESLEGTTIDLENQDQGGPGLVRRDSLFSVNTERNSLRRKRSDKQLELQVEENHPQSQQPDSVTIKQSEPAKGRRASNGLQYLFPQTSSDRRLNENLSLYPTGAHNQLTNTVKTNNLDGCPDSPYTPPPVMHPETAFVVSTIIPKFLYLGPEISKKEEVEEIEAKGIKRILNMAFECADTLGLNEKFDQYLKLNVKDSVEEDVESGLKAAVAFIEQAERDQMPVYVHCKAGKSRSVTAVLAFLIKSRQWTLKHAYDYVMERRSGICPNIGFVAELMRVEEVVLGIKRNNGLDARKNEEMMSMEGVESLAKTPQTAFF